MKRWISFLLILQTLWGWAATGQENEVVAQLYAREGDVTAQRYPESAWRTVEPGAEFRVRDVVRVGKHGRAAIKFSDGLLMRMGSNAAIIFEAKDHPDARGLPALRLLSGALYLFSREEARHPSIVTPVVTAAIHGTEFTVTADASRTSIAVIQGAVEAVNQWGTVLARDLETIEAAAGRAPVKGLLLDPVGAVQWTLSYPPVLDVNDYPEFLPGANAQQTLGWDALQHGDYDKARGLFSGTTWRDVMGQSLALSLEGRAAEALDVLERCRGAAPATFSLQKSALHLAFGEVPEAETELAAAARSTAAAPPELQPRLRAAHGAQAAVVALARNEASKAQALADQALAADPQSGAAALALSYVEQARFDLEAAKRRVEALSAANPHSADLLLRLAELELGFNDVDAAEQHVREAHAQSSSARAYAMLGFVQLFKNENPEALASFQQAVALDGGSALARLGLGLALIRENDLERGRAELEQAVHLAPNVSLYRSYLGKAFFEEDRGERAGREYELAMKLDPEDPTPYLYRAFNEVAENRVVNALRDVETSIDLNENRAVYRSRLLLDADIGARTANLAQVFRELGFHQAARVEAIKSVSADYGNYSGHRLLAESEQSPYRSRAAWSELEIWHLLAPLSFNIINNTRGDPSMNEYTALIDRIEQRTGVIAEADTQDDSLKGEIFKAGRGEKVGWLMDASSGAANGSKQHNYDRENWLWTSGQYQPNYANRVLVDGALAYYSYRDNSFEEVSDEGEWHAYFLNTGYYHRISPSASLLGGASWYRDKEHYSYPDARQAEILVDSGFAAPEVFQDLLFFDTRARENIDQAQTSLQHIWDSRWLSTIIGYEHVFSAVEHHEDSPILGDELGVFPGFSQNVASDADYNLDADTAYSYGIMHLTDWADVTAGVSYASVDFEKWDWPTFIDETGRRSMFCPKAGLMLSPTERLAIRGGYFMTAGVPAVEYRYQLEPTLVGGINQVHDDPSGTFSENYGIGIDYKWPGRDYVGVELIKRNPTTRSAVGDLAFAIESLDEGPAQSIEVREAWQFRSQDSAKAYYYHVFNNQLVGTLDYFYARETMDFDFSQKFERHTTSAALRYFHPSNIFTYLRGSFRNEIDENSWFIEDGSHNLWTLDLGIGYRLPDRHGIVSLELLNLTDEKTELDESYAFDDEPLRNGLGGRLTMSVNF